MVLSMRAVNRMNQSWKKLKLKTVLPPPHASERAWGIDVGEFGVEGGKGRGNEKYSTESVALCL